MCNSAEPSDSQSVQSTNCYLQDKIHAYSCYSRLLVNHLYCHVHVTHPPPLDTQAHPHSWCTLTQCCPDHWKRHRWQGPCLVHASLAAADRYQNSQCCHYQPEKPLQSSQPILWLMPFCWNRICLPSGTGGHTGHFWYLNSTWNVFGQLTVACHFLVFTLKK